MPGMRLELGRPVNCSDGEFGELADVVIDPISRRVTHLVVAPRHDHHEARLVPITHVRRGDDAGAPLVLALTIAELEALERIQKSAFLRLGDTPVEDPDWEIGIQDILALPYYQSLAPGGVGPGVPPLGFDDRITEVYDRIPKDKIEVRRASAVLSADGHSLGHVDGFVVDDADAITHLVLEHGHLWGKREVTIPVGAIATIANDEVTLSLTKDQVGELESVPVRRWSA